MAAAQSPCGGLKNRFLHFKVKSTPLKDKKWKKKIQKRAQFSFCGGREAFHQEIVLRGIQSALKCNQGSEVFSEFSGTFCTLWPSKIMFLKGNLCIYKCFINVLYIFFFGAREKVQNAPRFEMNFLLNFAMCSADFTCVNGCTIDSVTRIALRD